MEYEFPFFFLKTINLSISSKYFIKRCSIFQTVSKKNKVTKYKSRNLDALENLFLENPKWCMQQNMKWVSLKFTYLSWKSITKTLNIYVHPNLIKIENNENSFSSLIFCFANSEIILAKFLLKQLSLFENIKVYYWTKC